MPARLSQHDYDQQGCAEFYHHNNDETFDRTDFHIKCCSSHASHHY